MPPDSTSRLLRPAGLAYGMVMNIRNALYDRGILKAWQSPIPVVSVGNITTGGTGKTPLVDWIVKFYQASGLKAAIISRGYGRRTKGVQLVSDGQSILLESRDSGDETAMLAARNPSSIVIVAEKRQAGVEFLMQKFADHLPDVIVLDDAFQHRKIARDLDIVVVNALDPLDGAAMLPEGHLREPVQGLTRADLIILGKIVDEKRSEAMMETLKKTGKPVLRSKIRPSKLVPVGKRLDPHDDGMMGKRVRALAFAGIGAPTGFMQSLKDAGIDVAASRFFRDHEPYTETSVRTIVSEAALQELTPVTTEKDWFRLKDDMPLAKMLEDAQCSYLAIEPEFPGGTGMLEKKLLSAAARRR
ncbi:MAG: tetraacyldisaccharide 4'-kinase [Chlorobiaceae bacterium]|nr:tetraacyldisaccharide 4'-kinase [Chlorobiaceae bacterium]